jgi:hypothetical protein
MSAAPVAAQPRPSKLSTTAIVAIAAVATLVLAGLGVLVGRIAESDTQHRPVYPGERSGRGSALGSSARVSAPNVRLAVGGGASDEPTQVESVTLGDGIAEVPVPPGWKGEVSEDQTSVWISDGRAYVYMQVRRGTDDVGQIVSNMYSGNWLSQNASYSQVETVGDIDERDLGGGASSAHLNYQALFTDDSATFSVYGDLGAVKRSDGWVLQLQLEGAGSTVDDAYETYNSDQDINVIFDGAVNTSFLGIR